MRDADRPGLDHPAAELPQLPAGYQYASQATRELSPAAVPVAALLTSLSRCARSLTFYSPNNRALRLFFDRLAGEMAATLDRHEVLTVQVEPTRFVFAGEAVFEDPDRERSLPFRLYRDGIRGVTFQRGIRREELLTLARILGVRETGQQLHGEDIVTRLWRAELPHVRHEVVKGFVRESLSSDEPEGGGVPGIMRRIHGALAFEGVDPGSSVELFVAEDDEEAPRWMGGVYPGNAHHETIELPALDEVPYPEISDEDLRALRAELDEENRDLLIRFLDFLLDVSITQGEVLRPEHFLDLVFDGWRKLLAEGQIGELVALVRYLDRLATSGEHGGETPRVATRILRRLVRVEPLRRVVASTPPDGLGPDQLEEYLRALGHRVDRQALLELLRFDMPEPLRETLQAFLAWRTEPEPGWLAAQLQGPDPLDVLTAIDTLAAHGTPEDRGALVRAMHHPLGSVRRHLLARLAQLEYDDDVRRALARAVRDADPLVRDGALEQIAEHADPRAAGPLIAEAERMEIHSWTDEQRAPMLRAIACSDPLRLISWVLNAVQMSKPWSRRNARERAWAEMALQAMEILGDPAARDVLRQLKDIGDDDYRRRVLKAYLEVNRRLKEERGIFDPEGTLKPEGSPT